MKQLTLRSACKINLTLRITGTRPDGYHTLESIFLPLPEPHDLMHISPLPQGQGCQIYSKTNEIEPQNNTLYSAWKFFAEQSGFAPDLYLELEKNVPLGSGLGGGSANAATLLEYLNRLLAHTQKRSLPQKTLHSIAEKIGADVPFFLYNHPALVTGIGEKISLVDFSSNKLTVLLICPDIRIETAMAYATWDKLQKESPLSEKELLTSSAPHDKKLSVHECWIKNDLEAVVFALHPKLRYLKEELLAAGANAAAMSGSGASIFGLFFNAKQAQQLAQKLQRSGSNVFCQTL